MLRPGLDLAGRVPISGPDTFVLKLCIGPCACAMSHVPCRMSHDQHPHVDANRVCQRIPRQTRHRLSRPNCKSKLSPGLLLPLTRLRCQPPTTLFIYTTPDVVDAVTLLLAPPPGRVKTREWCRPCAGAGAGCGPRELSAMIMRPIVCRTSSVFGIPSAPTM